MLHGGTVASVIDAFAAAHRGSMPHRTAIALALAEHFPGRAAEAVALLADLSGSGVTPAACAASVAAMRTVAPRGGGEAAAHAAACAALFPRAAALRASPMGGE